MSALLTHRRLATLVMAMLVGVASPAAAQAPDSPVTRTFTVRSLRLGEGENIAFHLHPTAHPIDLRAHTQASLEACPIGWPSSTGFVDCLPLVDGTLTLPSVGVDSFHLGFFVQSSDGTAARIETFTIEYEPGDGFFLVDPPALAPGATSAAFLFVPTVSRTVGIDAFRPEEDPSFDVPEARLRVTQHGRRLNETTNRPPGGSAPGYGPVRLGTPVKAQVRSTAETPLTLQLEISWD